MRLCLWFLQAAAAAEEKLDLADATAAAEAKAFAEAQAAKREVEAAVAAKAKKAIAKREAEAAVLSQMNEVPLMVASCCTEACVAVMVRFQWAAEWGGQEVFLAGTFSDWEELPVERSPSGDFVLALTLEPGHYSYKYKVDGKWRTSHMEPQVSFERRRHRRFCVSLGSRALTRIAKLLERFSDGKPKLGADMRRSDVSWMRYGR